MAEAAVANDPVVRTAGNLTKRVMKGAGNAYFFGGAGISPGKRAKSGTVWSELSCGNLAFTSILGDYSEEKNSQELRAMCVAQTDVP